jgi:transposase-like protein
MKDKPSSELFCPHCQHTLYKWKEQDQVTIYKCGNKNCPCRIQNLKKLNPAERMMQKLIPTHFKLNYQYREYHLTPDQIQHSKPKQARVDLTKIYNTDNVLGLILAFYVSFAMSAKKTALILRMVYDINVSSQTILNYAQAAACHCHPFNLKHKGSIDDICSGDETYIKVLRMHHYVWLFVSSEKRSIIAYHVSDNRGVQPAIVAMNEAIRTAQPNQDITLITDGNPSYPAGLHFLNEGRENKIKHIKVIGLENLDKDSTEYRAYKQIIERLNRTYKQHVKPAAGFNSIDGAVSLTTLFVTYYNFLRPHMSLNYKTPIHIPELDDIKTIQSKWIKILSMAA